MRRFNKYNGQGFTLLEIMAATVIGGFIAVVALGVLRTVTSAKEMVYSDTNVSDELRFAAGTIRNDLTNLYRDQSRESVKLIGSIEETDYGLVTSLTMRVVGTVKARFEEPEGDIYEVQYYLQKDEDNIAFMRRLCPIVGVEDDSESAGGMLVPIAENVIGFGVRYYDGYEWLDLWGPEESSLPKLVEVTLIAQSAEQGSRKSIRSKSFVVTFPRLGQMNTQGSDEKEDENRT